MKIDKDHLYYGAAVIQIAEDDLYTSINQFEETVRGKRKKVRCAYVVNKDIGLYLKYRTVRRTAQWGAKHAHEVIFQFGSDERQKIDNLASRYPQCFLGLICVHNEAIICLSLSEFQTLVKMRRQERGIDEDSYSIVVALFKGRDRPKVYVTPPGRRNMILGRPIVIPESAFPRKIFSD